jgi:uncharacterized protein (TIGR02757 family)
MTLAPTAPPLHRALLRLRADFEPGERLAHDPLGLVRPFTGEDRVIVAHIASALAYGGVDLIRRAIQRVVNSLQPSPSAALDAWVPGDFLRSDPAFVYRMTRAEDVDAYLSALATLRRTWGSLEAAMGQGGVSADDDVVIPLQRYVHRLRAAMPVPVSRGMRYLTPDPGSGSASKRWFLMLRWLVRPDDGADLGAWTVLQPSQLLMPLDTHTSRLAHWLGLTQRATVDLKMAREVTAALRSIDPIDPLSFDMPLCHLGIARNCLHRFVPSVCERCTLCGICVFTAAEASGRV